VVQQVDCDTCSCAPDDPGIWYYEDVGWAICKCSCHHTQSEVEARIAILDFEHDLATREVDPERQAQIEEVRWEIEEIDLAKNSCKYCKGTLHFEPFEALKEKVPREVHSRMAFGVEHDKDGRPFHMAVWQCLEVERKRGKL
jgi:hypothetical protein